VRERLGLFVGVCRAVQHAHQKGVIHRDLKPSNILVAEVDGAGVPKVIDFGVAKLLGEVAGSASVTRFGLMAGTPLYMAPEQANPLAHVDTRADVFALGVILFELLTGTTPLDPTELSALTSEDILRRVCNQTPLKPSTVVKAGRAAGGGAQVRVADLPGELDWVVLKCLQPDPNDRYPTADHLAADLERYLRGEAVSAHPPSRWYAVRKFVRRHRGPVAAAVAMLALLVAGVVGTTLGLVQADKQRRIAEEKAEAETRAKDDAEAAHRAAELSRADAEAARDSARRRYALVTDAYSKLTYEVQEKLKGRPDMHDLRRELLVYARDGLQKQLSEKGRTAKPDGTLVASYVQLGGLDLELGNSDDARRLFQTALDLAEQVVAQSPDDVSAVGNLIAALNQLGWLARSQGKLADAKRYHERAVAEAERMTKRAADRFEVWNSLALSLSGLADVCVELSDLPTARTHYQRALKVGQQLADQRPDDQILWRELAVSHERLGSALYLSGQHAAAEEHYRRMNGIQTLLFADSPANVVFRRDLSVSLNHLGKVALAQKDPRRALGHFEGSLAHRLEIAALDPRSMTSKRDLVASYEWLAEAHLALGQTERAVEWLTKKLDLSTQLAQKSPADLQAQKALARTYDQLGRAVEKLGRRADALAHFTAGLRVYERIADSDRNNLSAQREVVRAHATVGEAHWRVGDRPRMLDSLRKSLELAQGLANTHPDNPSLRTGVYNAHLRLAGGYTHCSRYADAVTEYEACSVLLTAMEVEGKLPTEYQQSRAGVERELVFCRNVVRVSRQPDLLYEQPVADIPRLAEACVRVARADLKDADADVQRFAEWVAKQPAPRAELEYRVAVCWGRAAAGKPIRGSAADEALAVLKRLDAGGYFTPDRLDKLRAEPAFSPLRAHPPFAEWLTRRLTPPPREQLPPPRKAD
jgi:serine/threonine-protein kinase